MPNIQYPRLLSFSRGELAPALHTRVDLDLWRLGLSHAKNVFVHVYGSVSNRSGTLLIAETKYHNKKSRLIPFKFSTQQNYILEFGHKYIRFYMNGGRILKSSAPDWLTGTDYVEGDYVKESTKMYYCLVAHKAGTFATDLSNGKWVEQSVYEIPSPYEEDDLPLLNYTQSADVLYITHPEIMPMELARYAHDDWRMTDYNFKGGPFLFPNTDENKKLKVNAVSGTGKTLTPTGFTFEDGHVGSIWRLEHYVAGVTVTKAFSSTSTSDSLKCGGTWRIITHGTWTGKLKIEKSSDGGTTWTQFREYTSANDFNINTFGSEDMTNIEPFLLRMNYTHTLGTCNADLSSDPFFQHGIVRITAVAGDKKSATVDIEREVASTDDTIDWAEGAWSYAKGWPKIVEFLPQDRLVFANNDNNPQTAWMTRIGNYNDFSRNEPLQDDDGITTNLPSREMNGIESIVPLSNILLLTSAAEWGLLSSNNAAITPTTILQKVFGYEGSDIVRPVTIGNRAIYVQALGSALRDIGYELYSDSFTGSDISVLSNHLFTGYRIKEMAYQQNPDRLVWCVRNDGRALTMTYMREQEVLAWTWQETYISGTLEWETEKDYYTGNWVLKDGKTYQCLSTHTSDDFDDDLEAGKWVEKDTLAKFESVASIPSTDHNEVWFIVQRDDKRYVELLSQRMKTTKPEDQIFMDCAITYSGAPTDTITGLDHLEGKTVAILADGNVIPHQVVKDGEITLDREYSKVHIGIPYVSEMETLNIDVPLADGTMQGRKVKVSQIVLRLLNSRGGYIGPTSDNLHEMASSFRAAYGTSLELFTGDIKEVLGGHYGDGGKIFIRQQDPLPMTILALIPSITPGGVTSL